MKSILFLMSGSIAAYKACQVISDLIKKNIDVNIVASPSTFEFVGNSTLEGLSSKPVISSLFEKERTMDHIHLVRQADLVILCPATAKTINGFASGSGDSLLTTFFLAHEFNKPFLVAPAMNQAMWRHPVTCRSISSLKEMGLKFIQGEPGDLACGEYGEGRMAEPQIIVESVLKEISL